MSQPRAGPSLRSILRHSVIEGGLYAAMVGFGEVFFVANAVRLGASAYEMGLVVTLPLFIGSIGPILALRVLRAGASRKSVVVTGATGQALTLCCMLLAEAFGFSSPPLQIALQCGYQVGGQAAGMAWSSWFGDIVPSAIRGRYFSRRNRVVHSISLLTMIAAGLTLDRLEPGRPGAIAAGAGGYGFVVIFAIAAICRFISAYLLAKTPEPEFSMRDAPPRGVWETFRNDNPSRRLFLVAGLLQFGVYLGSSYFQPYMLGPLALTYREYTAAVTAAVLTKVLTLLAWGRVTDQFGARSPFLLAVFLVGIIPLPWLFAHGPKMAILAQAVSGLAWGGHELSQFMLMLESSKNRSRAELFAGLTVVTGFCQLVGSQIGASILRGTHEQFLIVFAVSMVARLMVASAAPALIRPLAKRREVERRRVFLRLVGFRASGGLVHRLVFLDAKGQEVTQETITQETDDPESPSDPGSE